MIDKFISNTKVKSPEKKKKCTPVQSITMRYSSGEMRKAQGVFTSPQLRLWVQTAAVRGEGRPMPWPTRPSWIRHTLSRTNKKACTHTQKLGVQCEHVMWQCSHSQPCGQSESCRSAASVTDPPTAHNTHSPPITRLLFCASGYVTSTPPIWMSQTAVDQWMSGAKRNGARFCFVLLF